MEVDCLHSEACTVVVNKQKTSTPRIAVFAQIARQIFRKIVNSIARKYAHMPCARRAYRLTLKRSMGVL